MTARIPMSITHTDFVAAMTPLLDLLGVSDGEIVGDIRIIAVDRTTDDALFQIRFDIVAPPADAPSSRIPDAVPVASHPQDDEFQIWTHRIEVAVTNS